MTVQEFDVLPDIEVDVLVAEHVMGHQWLENPGECEGILWLTPSEEVQAFKDGKEYPHEYELIDDHRSVYCERYSKDLNAFQQVQEKLLGECVHVWPDEAEPMRLFIWWLLEITRDPKKSPGQKLLCATARQKCKAALMAVGVIK